jgi:nitrogen fixation/metabolism regulation signal transduction histidine kinase
MIPVDKNRLWQVITNLMKNAYEAVDREGNGWEKKSIILESSSQKGRAGFAIFNTGIGPVFFDFPVQGGLADF